MRALALVTVAGVLLACGSCKSRFAKPSGPGPIVDLDTDITGLSGLTRDGTGALWAAGEHADAVLRIDPSTFAVRPYPVVGAPPGVDLEGLTWVSGERFFVGTETQERRRGADVLLEGRVEGERFVLQPRESFAYEPWKMVAPKNRGIEGLCHVDGQLILATELVDEKDGERWAPVAMLDLATQAWSRFVVQLTTDTGKLAGVGCRVIDGEVVALAVERHFGVCRLLRFPLRPGKGITRVEPELAADLAQVIKPLPNFEGVVWNDDGSVLLLTDNHYRGRAPDPSRLYFVPAELVR